MPSGLGIPIDRIMNVRQNVRSILRGTAPVVVPTRGGWGGLVSNIDYMLLEQRASEQLLGLVPVGEKLTADYGWIRYQDQNSPVTAPLPLGGVASGFPAAPGHPIIQLMHLPAFGANVEQNLALTARLGGTSGTLFRFTASVPNWVEVPVAAGSTAIGTLATIMVDHTTYEPAGIVIFVNGNDSISVPPSNVYFYPNGAGEYEHLPRPTSAPDLTAFKARSVAVHHERVFFLNTSEGPVTPRRPQRVRWTTPGWSVPAATIFSGVGAGALDFNEFGGEGVKVLGIGDRIACYFEDGVGMLERTFIATRPFIKRIVTRKRGLVGRRALVDIGGGVHFGVFSDGMWLMDQEGNFREAGRITVNGVSLSKFKDAFYANITGDSLRRVACYFDAQRRFVYISWRRATGSGTSSTPNRVWIYDVDNDRVFEDLFYVAGREALSWGEFKQVASPALTWAGAAGAWGGGGTGSSPWGAFIPTLNRMRQVHGTETGFIFEHDPDGFTRDGVVPTWSIATHPTAFGDPNVHKTLLRWWLYYEQKRLLPAPVGISLSVFDPELGLSPLFIRSVNLDQGVLDAPQVHQVYPHATANLMRFVLTGSHPVVLQGWAHELVGAVGEEET